MDWFGRLLVLVGSAGLLVVAICGAVSATTFSVDSDADFHDLLPGDGVCAGASGSCSLRAALEESNASPGADEIRLPPGLYDVFGPALTISDEVRLVGAEGTSTTRRIGEKTRIRARNRASVITIVGGPSVVISDVQIEGGRSDRGAGIDNLAGVLTLTDVTLKFNRSREGLGGAVFNAGRAHLERVRITGNVGRVGGAVYNATSGVLTVLDSTLRRNRHRVPGGGGCVYNGGVARIERSLLARCQGRVGDGGGGILNRGDLVLTNSTLWGCRARLGRGGAIFNDLGAFATIENATIVRNQAAFVGAGIVNEGGMTVRNSILWGNFSRDRDSNCGGGSPVVSLGHNIDGGHACGFAEPGDRAATDPEVGRDADNGGPTRTRGLLPGSPAVDAADDASCPVTDQRGVIRPTDGDADGGRECDIGAFEASPEEVHRLQRDATISDSVPRIAAHEFQANSESVEHQHAPAVATLPNGDLVVAWQAGPELGGDGSGYGIFAQRFDARGAKLGPEVRLNDRTDGDQVSPAIAVGGDAIVAVWISDSGDTATSRVVARVFEFDLNPRGGEIRVDEAREGHQESPDLAVADDGAVTVVWLEDAAGTTRVMSRRLAPDGELARVTVVDDGAASDVVDPAVAVVPDGRHLVVWIREREDRPTVVARAYDAFGVAVDEPVTVWQADEDLPDLPSTDASCGPSGQCVVVWQVPGENPDGEQDVISAQRMNVAGRLLGKWISVSRSTRGYRAQPRVAIAPGGHFLVVWESQTDDDVGGSGVTARRLDAEGKVLGGEFNVSTRRTVYQVEPAVAAHGNGAFQVVWASDALDGDGFGVFGHSIAVEGFVGYRVKETRAEENKLPRPWALHVDDRVIADAGGDDPEVYEVRRVLDVYNPTIESAEDGGSEGSLLRYSLARGREGLGLLNSRGKRPRAAKHRARRWELDNRFGTVVVESKRVASLLTPAAIAEDAAGREQLEDFAYVCYLVAPMRGEESAQAPNGRFRRDLQLFARDRFDDCATDQSGARSFAGTVAEGACLLDLLKPVELCNPVAIRTAPEPRRSAAKVVPVVVSDEPSLLCYAAKLATKVAGADAAFTLGVRGQIRPRQLPHESFRERFGTALRVRPGIGFPAPRQIDTSKMKKFCVPTSVRAVSLLE